VPLFGRRVAIPLGCAGLAAAKLEERREVLLRSLGGPTTSVLSSVRGKRTDWLENESDGSPLTASSREARSLQ
jgi:hypothetical protein